MSRTSVRVVAVAAVTAAAAPATTNTVAPYMFGAALALVGFCFVRSRKKEGQW